MCRIVSTWEKENISCSGLDYFMSDNNPSLMSESRLRFWQSGALQVNSYKEMLLVLLFNPPSVPQYHNTANQRSSLESQDVWYCQVTDFLTFAVCDSLSQLVGAGKQSFIRSDMVLYIKHTRHTISAEWAQSNTFNAARPWSQKRPNSLNYFAWLEVSVIGVIGSHYKGSV